MKPRDKEREGNLMELWMIEMSHNRSCVKVFFWGAWNPSMMILDFGFMGSTVRFQPCIFGRGGVDEGEFVYQL